MTTTTFSSRADTDSLAFANALTREQYGISFGQYCGSLLLGFIEQQGQLPSLDAEASRSKQDALEVIRSFPMRAHRSEVGRMTDKELRDLIAGRYA